MRLTIILVVFLLTTPLMSWAQKSSLAASPSSVARDLNVKEFQKMMGTKPGACLMFVHPVR